MRRAAWLLCWTCACGEEAAAPSSAISNDPASFAPPGPSASSDLARAAEEELSTKPLELLRHRFTSGVKDREPVDRLSLATSGSRVYAHFTVRNRSGRDRQLTAKFSVNGQERSEVLLDVKESWSYRTWAYVTLRDADKKGTLELSVTDDEGHPLLDDKLPLGAR